MQIAAISYKTYNNCVKRNIEVLTRNLEAVFLSGKMAFLFYTKKLHESQVSLKGVTL